MKKILLFALIVLALIIPKLSYAKKFIVRKDTTPLAIKRKIHPLEKEFSRPRNINTVNSRNYNNLLVLLIDFPEDSLSTTTGTGKFLQDATGYSFPIGRPPHDQTYFTLQLEALTHYYNAVSLGDFQVEVDIFPQAVAGEDFTGYTLPHEMSYYNPIGASSELMIERFEQYFLDCFNEADDDDDIDFSQYEHFMFIHAGSDWQHDVWGDSPSDLPSFYIVVGDGKEAIVDDGDVIINHACNIPETIIQDSSIDESGSVPVVSNWGVINSVMVHEFGHSIGFVDLYNTRNYTPQVGFYDIMDSGGSTAINFGIDETGNGQADIYYEIEGIFPALPGAWSRTIAFEDSYRARGILKDIDEFTFDSKITVLPAEKMFDAAAITDSSAYIIKIPLSETEYLLVENRQVDPDGDGGAYPWLSADDRVVLYPTYPDPNLSYDPTYEYDYLLPGWISNDYSSFGGGLLIWHIDEKILYENNNYENNTINIRHSSRAVKIVEADGLDDIGNPNSMFWRGTSFEAFYKYYPLFDEDGWFIGWDNDYILNSQGDLEFIGTIFNNRFSSSTKPALMTNDGDPFLYSIYDISSCSVEYGMERTMSFKFGADLFDVTQKIAEYDSIRAIGHVGNSNGYPTFPVVSEDGIDFISYTNQIWQDTLNVDIIYDSTPTQQILSFDEDGDGEDEYYFVNNSELSITSPYTNNIKNYSSNLSDVPLFIQDWNTSTLVVPTEDSLFVGEYQYDIQNSKCVFDGKHLIVTSENSIHFLNDPELTGALNLQFDIENYDQNHIPVCYIDTNPNYNSVFIQNIDGDIFRIRNNKMEEIFKLSPYSSEEPSQLALGDFLNDGQIYLTFGAGNRVFAITLDGTLAPSFPAYIDDKEIKPASYPRIVTFIDERVILLEEMDNGFVAINKDAELSSEHSFFWEKVNTLDQFHWDENIHQLHFIYSDISSNLYASYLENIEEDPIIWNGYRNDGYNTYSGSIQYEPNQNNALAAFCFPNPTRHGEVRVKVKNAKAEIDLKIFDIAGNIVWKDIIEKAANNSQDIRINTSKMASGVYFGIISSEKEIKKISFAVIN
ncbi:MAG: T9SS type A sorting domain-containing protein [Candidatus Tenebribacter burtonii]|jgi:M6 family metalloprotease-like protein|nr:T9SS type A sorting domain-containing protein [Candidatus Tenebribacter burtonii]